MSRENETEKAARVSVPKELYNELFHGPHDLVTDYILGVNSQDVAMTLLASGTLDTESDITVTFVPQEGLSKGSTIRHIKLMEVIRDPRGQIVDVKVSDKVIQWSPDRKN